MVALSHFVYIEIRRSVYGFFLDSFLGPFLVYVSLSQYYSNTGRNRINRSKFPTGLHVLMLNEKDKIGGDRHHGLLLFV